MKPVTAYPRGLRLGLAVILLVAAFIAGAPIRAGSAAAAPERWIVQVQPDAKVADVVRAARIGLGARPSHRFETAMHGFAAWLTAGQRADLLADPRVATIVPDQIVRAAGEPASEVQSGIRRVGALENPDRSGATLDVDIAVLDTGLQPDNADLNVQGGYNCTDPSQSEAERTNPANWRDSASFGHGTHVAGVAAGENDGNGIEGVAAGARLWAIKVLTGSGLGYWSWIICGLDRVAEMREPGNPNRPRIEVANMSLAGPGSDDGNCGNSNHDPVHQAVCRLVREGVTIVAAAANESTQAARYIPAAYDEVITVSAMADWNGQPGGSGNPPGGCSRNESDDEFGGFSNFGSDVDLIAPGVCILSTLPNDRFGRLTGTSVATPHVSGGAALYYLWEERLGRPRPAPAQVRAALMARGTFDWRTGTDPDHVPPEPALQVSNFNLSSRFALSSTPQVRRATGGQQVNFDIWVSRISGFGAPVQVAVDQSTMPAGASASIQDNPSVGPSSGSARVTIDLPGSVAAGTYAIQIEGSGGGQQRSTTVFVAVERQDAGGPQTGLRSGLRTDGPALPVAVTWPQVGGAQSYQLQLSADDGPWKAVATTSGTKFNTDAWPGRRYQYRVRARVSGNWGAWRHGPSATVTPYYAPLDGITLTGNWTRTGVWASYGELPVHSSQAGAHARLDFVGRSVAWIASRGPNRGRADVYLDGQWATRVDLHAGSTQHKRLVFSHSWSGFGNHSIRIEVLGAPSNRPRIDVDAVVVVTN